MTKLALVVLLVSGSLAAASCHAQEREQIERLLRTNWHEVFYDPCTEDWRKR